MESEPTTRKSSRNRYGKKVLPFFGKGKIERAERRFSFWTISLGQTDTHIMAQKGDQGNLSLLAIGSPLGLLCLRGSRLVYVRQRLSVVLLWKEGNELYGQNETSTVPGYFLRKQNLFLFSFSLPPSLISPKPHQEAKVRLQKGKIITGQVLIAFTRTGGRGGDSPSKKALKNPKYHFKLLFSGQSYS